MKKALQFWLTLLLTIVLSAEAESARSLIWDNAPASDWEVAYPVGNGRLGAMPFGEFPSEKILINEETLWANGPALEMPEDSFEHLEAIRELEAKEDYLGADRIFERALLDNEEPYSYQLAGWLNLEYVNTAPLKDTIRELDLRTGVAQSVYTLSDGSTITQQVYASAVDDVIAVSITSSTNIDLKLSMEGGIIQNGDLVKTAASEGENATRFVSRVRALPADKVTTTENTLEVKDAREITVYLALATDFDRQDVSVKLPDGWQNKALQDLDALAAKSAEQVQQDAIADHQSYFERVEIDLGETDEAIFALPTPERVQRIRRGAMDDPDLVEDYFQFGRYLLIASSRPGTFPANLQGIWNPHLEAPWSSDYHLNINLQMNYWLAETTNLSEMHEPLFDLIRLHQPKGKDMARRLGMQGWCMGHCTDLWGNARTMSRRALWGSSFFGGQWIATHILEHYRFNLDPQFLEDNWDILTASTEFVLSWLIPGPEEGMLMARPAGSPENRFIYTNKDGEEKAAAMSAGNTFDQYIILQVFNDYLQAAEVLGRTDDALVQEIRATLPKIFQPRIGEDGRLMEWRKPFGEQQPGHRHISHVVGAFPGNQINLDEDPEMRDAVLKSLEGRLDNGGAKTGWSRAWMIGMFARLSDGARAYENLYAILRRSTLDNLWDTAPPYMIDGNFGSTAAIAEMLLHSHNHEIKLLPALPALPDQWPEGFVKGLRARADYTVDIQWKDGELVEATIHAGPESPESVAITYEGKTITLQILSGRSATVTKDSF